LNLKPVLASSEAIQREIKKRLGVGADTIGTLDEEKGSRSLTKMPRTPTSTRPKKTKPPSSASSIRF